MTARKNPSNKLIYGLGAAFVLLILAAFIGKRQGWIGQPEATEVIFEEVVKRTIVEKVSASGDIQPEIEVKLSPDVAGEIIQLNVDEGDSVQAGQLLIKIRPDNFQAAVERSQANWNQQLANLADARAKLSRAQAQFERSKLEFERNQKLIDQQVISDTDFEVAEVNFKVATYDLESATQNVEAAKYIVQSSRATVDEAKENLRLTDVIAPMNGIVSRLSVEQGERVVGTQQMAGTEMLRIANLRQMEVLVNVNENDIVRIEIGDTAIIDVDAYAYLDKEFRGVVSQIANTANPKPSSDAVTEFQVRVKILAESFNLLEQLRDNPYPFKPGMTASVDIITDRKENILVVPLAAVTMRDPSDTLRQKKLDNTNEMHEVVFVYKDDKAYMTPVETGISDFDYIEVISGLSVGQRIVSGPFQAVSKKLSHDDRVKEMEDDDGSE